MMKTPKTITPALLDVVVMPNGEVICLGKTIGWITELKRFLTPQVESPAPRATTEG